MNAMWMLASCFAAIIAVGGAVVAAYDWAVARWEQRGVIGGGPQGARRPQRPRRAPRSAAAAGVMVARPVRSPAGHGAGRSVPSATVRAVRRKSG